MDYIRMEDTPLAIALLVIGAVLVLSAIFAPRLEIGSRFAIVALGIVAAAFAFSGPVSAREDGIKNEISESYGLRLSDDQLRELDYPYGEIEAGFERYGSTVLTEKDGSGYIERRITLIWDGDKMILATTDAEGSELEPLELKR